jgi:hypothetical protein
VIAANAGPWLDPELGREARSGFRDGGHASLSRRGLTGDPDQHGDDGSEALITPQDNSLGRYPSISP